MVLSKPFVSKKVITLKKDLNNTELLEWLIPLNGTKIKEVWILIKPEEFYFEGALIPTPGLV